MSVILLSSWNAPELPSYLAAMTQEQVEIQAVICAGLCSERDRQIVAERTKGHFTPQDFFAQVRPTVPFYFVKNHNSAKCLDLLRSLKPTLLANAGTPNIIKAPLMEVAPVVNTHPGDLPRYRGCSAVEWALIEDQPVVMTSHFMDSGIDTGPIIRKDEMPLEAGWSYEQIRAKAIDTSCQALARAIAQVEDQKLTPQNLPPQGEGRYLKVFPAERMDELRAILAKRIQAKKT